MTFTSKIKAELCRAPVIQKCCAYAECFGMLLYGSRFRQGQIRLVTSSHEVQKRAQALFGSLFGATFSTAEGKPNTLVLSDENVIESIFSHFGFEGKSTSMWLNRAAVEEDCCRSAFIRGCFLMGGYVTSGDKGYHLEFVAPQYNLARQMSALLYDMGFEAGFATRRGNYVLYYKDSSAIEDLLSAMGATAGAMELMLQKVEKALVNKVNRKVNCETANLSKTVDAAARQVAAIEKMENAGRLGELSRELRETAELRKQYPELSLSELACMFIPPMSKPGLSNRLKKLINLSEEI